MNLTLWKCSMIQGDFSDEKIKELLTITQMLNNKVLQLKELLKSILNYWLYMEASEPKWVNPVLISSGLTQLGSEASKFSLYIPLFHKTRIQ